MNCIAKVGESVREELQFIYKAFRLKDDVIIYRRFPNRHIDAGPNPTLAIEVEAGIF